MLESQAYAKTIRQWVSEPGLLIYWVGDENQLGATEVSDTAEEKVWRGGERDGGRVSRNSHSSRRAE